MVNSLYNMNKSRHLIDFRNENIANSFDRT